MMEVVMIDDILVAAGIIWLVVRQFRWRDAAGMVRMAAALLAVAGVLLVQQALTTRLRWTALDLGVLAGELLLTTGIGVLMGGRYRLRPDRDRVLARLERGGIVLWAVFLVVRLGSFGLAHALGARAIESSGALLLVFGVNRLITGLVVRRRIAGGLLTAPA